MATEVAPLEDLGRDHWSVLGYIETCCVDHKGITQRTFMRFDGNAYLTRTKKGEVKGHSDND